MLYWYWAHDRGVASEYWAKFYLVKDAMQMNRSDGALVRITTPMYRGESSDAAQQRLLPFTSDLFPLLNSYIPTMNESQTSFAMRVTTVTTVSNSPCTIMKRSAADDPSAPSATCNWRTHHAYLCLPPFPDLRRACCPVHGMLSRPQRTQAEIL